MKKIFFDTWGWIAIAHPEDIHHPAVFSFYREFLSHGGIPVTTDYVLNETITLLRAKTDSKATSLFIEALLDGVHHRRIALERIHEQRWKKTWTLIKKYHDKPYISFVDFSSFVVMEERKIREVVTADRHFSQIGLGFEKLF